MPENAPRPRKESAVTPLFRSLRMPMGLCALAVFALLPAGIGHAAALGDVVKLPSMPSFEKIEVSADRMGVDRKTNQGTLDGNVCVRFSDVTMRCDHARYDSSTGAIHAEGNVSIVSEAGGSWHGESIDFNHKTGEGLFGTGVLRFGAFTVHAPDASRDDDGVFHAHDAVVTTCTNEPSAWHWSVTGTARYKDKEFMELRNASARLFGLPVMWYPYYYRDLNTNYGWRFMPGYTGKWGAYLKTGYVYPIAGDPERDRLLYGKTVVDLRSKFGVGAGQELTWATKGGMFGEDTTQWGRLSLYYANHHDDQEAEDRNWQSSYDTNRWSLGLTERLDFSPRDFLSIKGEAVSDSQFRTDYKELAVRAASQPLGIVNYEHRENAWVTALTVSGPINSFYAGVRRLPEASLDILPQGAFGIPGLFYESQNTVGWLERQPSKYDGANWLYAYQPGNWAYYEALRIDTRHVFRRPITLAEGITLTPRAGWRGTYYSDAFDGDSLFRSLFEFGATLQARYWRDFERIRHTVIPYLDFTWVPGSQDGVDDVPYAFDRLDQEYEWRDRYRSDGLTPNHRYTGLRFGLRNLLQNRTKNGLTRLLDLDLYGVYVFQTQDHWVRWTHRQQIRNGRIPEARRVKEEDGLRVLGLSGSYSPFKNVEFATDFQYDPEENRLAFWDINARYNVSALTLYLGYLRRHHDVYDYYWSDTVKDAVVYGGFIHSLCDRIDWSLYARYNIEYEDLEEIGGFLQYNLDCISFRCNLGYIPVYTSEDGYKHDPDFRISLGAWLRAFPRVEDEDWMSWGPLAEPKDLRMD